MCPFYFNDTAAYLIEDDFSKEEVSAEGYLWREEKVKVDVPDSITIVQSRDLDKYEETEGKIDPSILKAVICDEK